jgi:glutamate synthase (NADPH/NADH)
MEFLTAHTKSLLNSSLVDKAYINAKDKNVIVIGGGDTGTDCIATAIRHGCKSLVNMELLSKPPLERDIKNPWPLWPNILRTDYGHQESIERFGKDPREYEISSNLFVDDGDGKVSGLKTQSIEWSKKNGQWKMDFIQGTDKLWEADLILLAMGFTGPEKNLPDQLGVSFDEKENIDTPEVPFSTAKSGVFTAGDCRRGQSLVVWAINEGRGAASAIDKYLES